MGSIDYKGPDPQFRDPIISERSIDEPRPLKVIYIGAGISGICAAIQFPKYLPNISLTVYDKNADVGGTWFENRYPGCACDVPAHSYQLSFESSVSWTKFYAGAPEILAYWRRVAEKYGIRKYMKLRHQCIEARWNEETAKWHVKLLQLESGNVIEDTADVFLTGIGVLNDWKWPDIKGLKDFKAGRLMHSADWDDSFDARDKTVAVIGAGSSGIQIVPTIQPLVKSMNYFVRGRTWIASTFGNEVVRARNNGLDGNFTYTESEKEEWKKSPESYIKMRKDLEVGMQGGYAVTQRGSEAQTMARKTFDQEMRKRLEKKPEVAEFMVPDFPPLCKRLTPGPGYLEALTATNVNVITNSISHIDETGVVTADGTHHPVDAIICATGFDTSFHGHFPVYGRGGVKLQDKWAQRPETYLSTCTSAFPNFFQALGPNSGVGNGNLIIIIETLAHYHGQVLQKMATQNIRTIEVKERAVQNFTDYCDAYFKRTVFSAECSSWYKSSPPGASAEERRRGRVTALWPGSSMHAVKALQQPRFEDYDVTLVEENPFAWFGDGWTVAEREADFNGLTYYLDDMAFTHEELDVDAKKKQEKAEKERAGEEDAAVSSLPIEPGSILGV